MSVISITCQYFDLALYLHYGLLLRCMSEFKESDHRVALRRFFEVDRYMLVVWKGAGLSHRHNIMDFRERLITWWYV